MAVVEVVGVVVVVGVLYCSSDNGMHKIDKSQRKISCALTWKNRREVSTNSHQPSDIGPDKNIIVYSISLEVTFDIVL